MVDLEFAFFRLLLEFAISAGLLFLIILLRVVREEGKETEPDGELRFPEVSPSSCSLSALPEAASPSADLGVVAELFKPL